MVAEVVAETLSGSEIEPVMMEVTQKLSVDDVAPYDFFVVLTPTYNARPSQLLLDFIDGLPLARYEKLPMLSPHAACIQSTANALLGSVY